MIKKLLLSYLLFASLFIACSDNEHIQEPGQPLFFTTEVVKMMNDDYQTVQQQGWGNLVLPKNLYGGGTLTLSHDAQVVADGLHNAGFEVYLVGGTIRDFVMGTPSDDFDFVTNASYEQCDSLFAPDFHLHAVGETFFGAVQMPDELIDLIKYSAVPEVYYGHTPLPADRTPSLITDSFERDMPFNALYFDPYTEEILDFHGGIRSIYDREIKSMVNPDIQMKTDVNSIVRSIRFAARYEYSIDKELDKVLRTHGMEYLKNYPKNIFIFNLTKLFNSGYAQRCGKLLTEYGFWPFVVPSLTHSQQAEQYQRYLIEQMAVFDKEVNWKTIDNSEAYVWATFLKPRYTELSASLSAEAALAKVLEEQETTAELSDALKDAIAKIICP